jgi:co-chaperonin GroES (HSP10)
MMDKKGNRIPLGVAAGDKVLIPQFGGSPIKVGEEEFSLFRDHEYVYLLVVVEREGRTLTCPRLLAKINE